jgi:hypothetical protein
VSAGRVKKTKEEKPIMNYELQKTEKRKYKKTQSDDPAQTMGNNL